MPPQFLRQQSPLNGALDHNESTLVGTGSSHDTILVLFKNVPLKLMKLPRESKISTRFLATQSRATVKLRSTVNCQELISMGAMKERGEIPANCKVIEIPANFITPGNTALATNDSPLMVSTTTTTDIITDTSSIATDSSADISESTKAINSDNFPRIVNCFSKRVMHENEYVPGFTAARSTFMNCNFHPTTTVLTPILPYPATTYDAVLTTMINFQDALKQKGDTYGGTWADEGVYRIAKEIQLVKPDEFGNIFFGIGGFHMEKMELACIGAYLEPSGMFAVLVET